MTLSRKHVEDICLLNQGSACCRYLASDDTVSYKFHCLKHKSELKKKIDDVVNKVALSKDKVPVGNNCQGYPVLKNIEQGYDV
jgi:hypothetical protein